jgi:two-component system cell cycle sensor histidine kinase/response regulator CckA
MPTMGGAEVYERLREIDPAVRVLLSSGYSMNGEARKVLDHGGRGFIQKPFSLAELSGTIRRILDDPQKKKEE